jgi:hypothetical protein
VLRKHALRAHEAACALRPAACAACGVQLRAADLAAHEAAGCPEAKVLCAYAGCGVAVKRKDKHAHNFACWERHLAGEVSARAALDPAVCDAAATSAAAKKRLDALPRAASAAAAAEALRGLAATAVSVDGARLVSARKAVPAALAAFAAHRESDAAAAAACTLLTRLTPMLGRPCWDEGVPARVVGAAKDTITFHASTSAAAAAAATELLAALCDQPAFLPAAREGNALNAALAAARAQPRHSVTLRAACRVLHAVLHEFTELFADEETCAGAVEVASAALKTALKPEGDPDYLGAADAAALAEASAAALATAAAGRGFAAARDAGAMAAALAALRRWRMHPGVERHALRGVLAFHGDASARDALVASGGVRDVLSALHRAAAAPEALQPALLAVALYGGVAPAAAARWLAGGAADAALRALEEFPREALLLEASAAALAALAWPHLAAHGMDMALRSEAAGAGAGAAVTTLAVPGAAAAAGTGAEQEDDPTQPYAAAQLRIIAAGGGERLAAAVASARAAGVASAAASVARAVRALCRACPAGRASLLAHGAAHELLLLLGGAGDLTPAEEAADAAAWCLWSLRELLCDGGLDGSMISSDFNVADARAAVVAAAAPFSADGAVAAGEAALLRVLDAAAEAAAGAAAAADVAAAAATLGLPAARPA